MPVHLLKCMDRAVRVSTNTHTGIKSTMSDIQLANVSWCKLLSHRRGQEIFIGTIDSIYNIAKKYTVFKVST